MPWRRRSAARALALQALCAYDALGADFDPQLGEFLNDPEVHADLAIPSPLSAEARRFAERLARGAWQQRDELDRWIGRASQHWSISRMTPVDRNILRLGLYELLCHPETPPQVVLNEAVELAKRFGDANSPAFVNGVLDAVRRLIDGQRQAAAPENG